MELFRLANFYDNGALSEADMMQPRLICNQQSRRRRLERENGHARKMHSDDNMSAFVVVMIMVMVLVVPLTA